MAWRGESIERPATVLGNPEAVAGEIIDYWQQHREIFDLNNVYMGMWVNGTTLYVEPSARVADLAEAAVLAAQTFEISYYDNQAGTAKPTFTIQEITDLMTSSEYMLGDRVSQIYAQLANAGSSIEPGDTAQFLGNLQEWFGWQVRSMREHGYLKEP
jgi:hypothetical protein